MYEYKVSVITVMYECYLSLDLRTSSTFSGTRAHIHSSLLLISLKDTTGCYCGVLRFCEQLWDVRVSGSYCIYTTNKELLSAEIGAVRKSKCLCTWCHGLLSSKDNNVSMLSTVFTPVDFISFLLRLQFCGLHFDLHFLFPWPFYLH